MGFASKRSINRAARHRSVADLVRKHDDDCPVCKILAGIHGEPIRLGDTVTFIVQNVERPTPAEVDRSDHDPETTEPDQCKRS